MKPTPKDLLLYLKMSVSLSLHQKGFFCTSWWLTQKPTTSQGAKSGSLFCPSWTSIVQPFSQSSGTTTAIERLERPGWWGTTRKQCFLNITGKSHTWTHSSVWLQAFKLAQAPGTQNLSIDGDSGHKDPTLTEKLLAMNSFWKRKLCFSIGCPWWVECGSLDSHTTEII